MISFNIEGYFKNDRYKKLITVLFSCDIILDNSNKFIKIINIDIITKFINKYFNVNLNK